MEINGLLPKPFKGEPGLKISKLLILLLLFVKTTEELFAFFLKEFLANSENPELIVSNLEIYFY